MDHGGENSKGHEGIHTPRMKLVLRPDSVQSTEYLSASTELLRINQPSVLTHWPVATVAKGLPK